MNADDLNANDTSQLPPAVPGRVGRRYLALMLGAVILLVAAAALYVTRVRLPGAAGPQAPLPAGAAAGQSLQLPGVVPVATEPGVLKLDDFVITLPQGWQRRRDWEDEGPGTKLFLLGPKVGTSQVAIGIDVYPLRSGVTLDQFVKQYSARWNLALLGQQEATLSGQPARMLSLTEGGQDKLYLITTWRSKGFAIGMFGPGGHGSRNTAAYRQVVDTFQLYE